ncbi:luciferase [Rhizobium sp. AC44/96]|nr:luciferase [Rhizobium sp. AC44/96]
MANFKCVLVGDGFLLAQCAEMLRDGGHELLAVVTASEPVRRWAAERDVPVFAHDASYASHLAGLDYDWLFSIVNLKLVPDAVWRGAKRGAVNFHDGPLPTYAGLNTPSWALMAGERRYGITWHEITSGIDEGAIYAQTLFDVAEDETALTLNAKCFEAGMSAFATMLSDIERGSLVPVPQEFSSRRYFSRDQRPAAAGTISFRRPVEEISRLVRALSFGNDRANALVKPKLRVGRQLFHVADIAKHDEPVFAEPGTVLSAAMGSLVVAAPDGAVRVDLEHRDIDLSTVVRPGERLPEFDDDAAHALDAMVAEAARHEAWHRRALANVVDVDLLDIGGYLSSRPARVNSIELPLPAASDSDKVAMIAAFIGRLSKREALSIAYADEELRAPNRRFPGYFSDAVPLTVTAKRGMQTAAFAEETQQSLDQLVKRGSYLGDLVDRSPDVSEPRLTFGIAVGENARVDVIEGCAVTFVLGERVQVAYDENRVTSDFIKQLCERLAAFGAAFAEKSGTLGELPLMSAGERKQVLFDWNETALDYERHLCVHQLIERQVGLTPDAEALAYRDQSLTYAQMNSWANRIAQVLSREGVGPDALVGLHLPRSLELVVAALAVHKAGGAYVPLDPDFPAERLAFMAKDSKVRLVIAKRGMVTSGLGDVRIVFVDDIAAGDPSVESIESAARPENLAYVIYTSGSTGNPKGVMVEHRNVVNFFAGMDERIGRRADRQNVWLAVTSLSFDISVLELFWTLSRGFKVVIHASAVAKNKTPSRRPTGKVLDFGLFYWGNDNGTDAGKYNLLLEGAKFADQNDFQAVWTPERHFHAFGGPYPNPAVTGAAVAAVTKNVSIRAGSCVLPLHHPLRVAEEWAVVDNISNGRVAVAFASGWMPEDFVLRPENAPPRNKANLVTEIETVRKLWRGESVEYSFGSGTASVVTQPRPVQKELPIWLTTAGNPESYREAARTGANVLTHLLGQSVEELAEKIAIYRQTLVETGRNPDDYKVTLMLHTLLGEDRDEVRNLARGPMKEYLKSAAALIKQYAWAFPAFKKPQGLSAPSDIDLQSLSTDELDAILEFAFLRYFEDSGLFGTLEDAHARLSQVAAIGVDEIACLIDFGVSDNVILDRLEPLAQLVREARTVTVSEPAAELGFAGEVSRHGVTHFQCTPSMARMFLISEEDRAAFVDLEQIFIGGEALHGSLLDDMRRVASAPVTNMYGPTETTIWSATRVAQPTAGIVPLGEPIANTQLYVLDEHFEPVPCGVDGELYIGGDGVTRGYLNRPELTDERFLANPFHEGRMYRTGDMVRMTPARELLFLGRADHQVKVRGYRIELGEIEARANAFPGVEETVVLAREDQPGDIRIVAYVRTSAVLDETKLTEHLSKTLPDYMVPSHIVRMDAFPLTPNAKVDRGRLPAPGAGGDRVVAAEFVAPADGLQRSIAEAFKRVLGVERVGLADNFFALGGHSLLAVQVHRDLKAVVAPDLSITDLFRFPTVGQLADFIADRGASEKHLAKVADRAAMRRNAMGDRRREFQRS